MRVIDDPTSSDPYRRLLVLLKTNLAAAPTLAYRTVLVDGQIRVDWLGESSLDVRDFSRGGEDSTKLLEAMEVLYLILRHGARPAKEVISKAKDQGIAKRTLERAKFTLRVRSEREKFNSYWHWVWRLPAEETPILQCLREKYEILDALPADGAPASA